MTAGGIPYANESFFTYPDNSTFEDYQFPEFEPTYFRNIAMNDTAMAALGVNVTEAKDICDNDLACLVDFLASGKAELARLTKTERMQEINRYTVLGT